MYENWQDGEELSPAHKKAILDKMTYSSDTDNTIGIFLIASIFFSIFLFLILGSDGSGLFWMIILSAALIMLIKAMSAKPKEQISGIQVDIQNNDFQFLIEEIRDIRTFSGSMPLWKGNTI